ncbi:hypothetical protein BGZ72_003551 [Mortierella alpina]|nr:hypothetical protein BGZ72_003551 [Mortierella alpina]
MPSLQDRDCDLSKIQSVAHAVKVRLTKAAEAERVLGDVIKEIAEENGSSNVDTETLVRRLLEELGIIDFNDFESSSD